MRVISQNGDVDLPYERIVVMRNFDNVIAVTDLQETQIVLGRYSSAEKAEKAIEMLRMSYRKDLATDLISEKTKQIFANSENSESNAEIMADIGEFLTECKYFRFPKDEEVEV